jgi:multimeric flavodoxin WrbA
MAGWVLEGAESAGAAVSRIYLDDYRVRPIGEVRDSSGMRVDPRRDDDFPALLERFLDADVVVWATPVYWHGPSAQMKCFNDRMSSYFNRPGYRERFTGMRHIVLCAYGREEDRHWEWVTEPMRRNVEVLRGVYLGNVHAKAYEKGIVREMPEVEQACRLMGEKAADCLR